MPLCLIISLEYVLNTNYTQGEDSNCPHKDLPMLVHTLDSLHTHWLTATQVPLQVAHWKWPCLKSGGRLLPGPGFRKNGRCWKQTPKKGFEAQSSKSVGGPLEQTLKVAFKPGPGDREF